MSGDVFQKSQAKFPFRLLHDGEGLLALTLKITKVPVKIYLVDGIIKKAWGGATNTEEKKSEFLDWIKNV
jgi:hypothetical protein